MNRKQRFTAQKNGNRGNDSPCLYHDGGLKARVNVGNAERILSAVAGGVLIKRNLGRFSLSGLAKLIAGAALMRRGITGHCDLYEAMNVNSPKGKEIDQGPRVGPDTVGVTPETRRAKSSPQRA